MLLFREMTPGMVSVFSTLLGSTADTCSTLVTCMSGRFHRCSLRGDSRDPTVAARSCRSCSALTRWSMSRLWFSCLSLFNDRCCDGRWVFLGPCTQVHGQGSPAIRAGKGWAGTPGACSQVFCHPISCTSARAWTDTPCCESSVPPPSPPPPPHELRSWLRHERMTVAMTLAEKLHHTSRGQKLARVGEEVVHDAHDALRDRRHHLRGCGPAVSVTRAAEERPHSAALLRGSSSPCCAGARWWRWRLTAQRSPSSSDVLLRTGRERRRRRRGRRRRRRRRRTWSSRRGTRGGRNTSPT